MTRKTDGGDRRPRRWISAAGGGGAPYEIRVLTGAHAGARLGLSDGYYVIGDDLKADLFLSDLAGATARLRLKGGRAGWARSGEPLAALPHRFTLGAATLLISRSVFSRARSAHCRQDPRNAPATRPKPASGAG